MKAPAWIALAIVVLLVICRVYFVYGMDTVERAKDFRARSDLRELASSLDRYRNSTGGLPSTEGGLSVLSKHSDAGVQQLLSEVPLDPWNHPYIYRVTPNTPRGY